jgi:hypothetical protein
MNPCLRYLADGVPHVWWFQPRAEMIVDLTAPDLAHALEIPSSGHSAPACAGAEPLAKPRPHRGRHRHPP